jgi:type II secretory pathway pseudopilin PulG
LRIRQQGATLAIVLIIFAIMMVAFLATYALSRLTSSSDERAATTKRLQLVADALEQFAAASLRLPCPANQLATAATETGLEVRDANAKGCTQGEGVVPWKTLGLRREDGYDGWGRRISYRVYTGNPGTNLGSLAQAGGVSMVDCDTVEPYPAGVDGNGLCVYDGTTITSRRTLPSAFLAGKGLNLNDMGVAKSDVAYVLISHGATGGGAFTASGARVELPTGDQLANTRELGGFTIKAFSDAETSAKTGTHFDDLLAYRTIPDLVKRINLSARDWLPDPANVLAGAVNFNAAAVAAAATAGGTTVSGTDTGTYLLDFDGAFVVGITNNNDLANISVDTVDSTAGIGVGGGGDSMMRYSERDRMAILFDTAGTQFSVTLNHFGIYTASTRTYTETVQFVFADVDGNIVGSTVAKSGCRTDGGLASYTIDVGLAYRWVYILPGQATASSGSPGDTGFYISEVRVCPSTETQCRTSLWSGSNACS